jgi:hypothetical protein
LALSSFKFSSQNRSGSAEEKGVSDDCTVLETVGSTNVLSLQFSISPFECLSGSNMKRPRISDRDDFQMQIKLSLPAGGEALTEKQISFKARRERRRLALPKTSVGSVKSNSVAPVNLSLPGDGVDTAMVMRS